MPSFLERPSAHTAQVFEVSAAECDRLSMAQESGRYARRDRARLGREEDEFRTADYLLCPSDFVCETFARRGYERSRLLRHRYGYDPARFFPETMQQDRPFVAAFVGLCFPLKGLHFALEAWHRSGAADRGTFLICGEFVPGYREALAKFLDHSSVRVLGFRKDVADLMRGADVLVHPSLSEGSALVTYEAKACGAALLVSDAAGAVCQHGRDALVHPAGDVAALTEHLRQVTTSPSLLRQLRLYAREDAAQLTWGHAGSELMGLYASHAGASPAQSLPRLQPR